MRITPLRIKILLESNPPKYRILYGDWPYDLLRPLATPSKTPRRARRDPQAPVPRDDCSTLRICANELQQIDCITNKLACNLLLETCAPVHFGGTEEISNRLTSAGGIVVARRLLMPRGLLAHYHTFLLRETHTFSRVPRASSQRTIQMYMCVRVHVSMGMRAYIYIYIWIHT